MADQTSTAAVEPAAKRSFSIPRLPGDIMIYPMVIGLLLNTFCPDLLQMGGFFTNVAKGGANAVVGCILLFIGAGINFSQTPKAIKCGLSIVFPKLVLAIALGLVVAFVFNDDFLGLNAVSVIGGITFCNIALYTGIMAEYGDEAERGAAGILCFTVGPTITMISLGAAGLADISVGTLVGCLLPLIIGMVLGNVSPFLKNLLTAGLNPCIFVIGFQLGCGMSLSSFLMGGLSGVVLAILCLVIGILTMLFERLVGGTGKAGMASGTIAGTAMTTPPAMAQVSEKYAALQGVAVAQIAVAVIITAFAAPVLTGWVDRHFCSGDKTDPAAEKPAAN